MTIVHLKSVFFRYFHPVPATTAEFKPWFKTKDH